MVTNLRVADDLWATSSLPQGLVERWRVANGSIVKAGQPLIELRIEDALHEVVAPSSGRLLHSASRWDTIEPGALLGYLAPVHPV